MASNYTNEKPSSIHPKGFHNSNNSNLTIRGLRLVDEFEGDGINSADDRGLLIDNDYDKGNTTRKCKGGIITTIPLDLSALYSKADDDNFFNGCGPSSGSFDMERLGGRMSPDSKGGLFNSRLIPAYDQSPKMYDGMSPNLAQENSWGNVFYMSPASAYSRTKLHQSSLGMGLQSSLAFGGSNYVPQSVPYAKSRRRPGFSIMSDQTMSAGWSNGSTSARNSAVVQYLNIGSQIGSIASSPPYNEVEPPGFPQLPGDQDSDKNLHSNFNATMIGHSGMMGKTDQSSINPSSSHIRPHAYDNSQLPAWCATPTHDWSDSVVRSQWLPPQRNIIPASASSFAMKGNNSSPVNYSSFPHYQKNNNMSCRNLKDEVPTEEVPGIPSKTSCSVENSHRQVNNKAADNDVSFSPWCNLDAVPEIRPAEFGIPDSKMNKPECLASLAIGNSSTSNASCNSRKIAGFMNDIPATPPPILTASQQHSSLQVNTAAEESPPLNQSCNTSSINTTNTNNNNGTPSTVSPMSNKSNNLLMNGGANNVASVGVNQLTSNGNKNRSLGSVQHPNECRPCAFFWTKGCINGTECRFCHEWHPPKKKKPMKEQKNLMIIARPDGKIEFMRCTVYEAMRVL